MDLLIAVLVVAGVLVALLMLLGLSMLLGSALSGVLSLTMAADRIGRCRCPHSCGRCGLEWREET